MKTPREILFARHQTALPKLDAIRREVVSRFPADRQSEASVHLVAHLWQELILPCRRLWTGLATVWVLIFIVNFTQRDNVNSITGEPAHPGQVVMSLQAQQRWADGIAAEDADRPRNFSPKPRTENSETAVL